MRTILALSLLSLAACADGLASWPPQDAGGDSVAAPKDPCSDVVHLVAIDGDPCAFTLPRESSRVDLYIRGQHQAETARIVDGVNLRVSSAFMCPKLRENPQWDVAVLLDCATPPSVLE